SHAATQAATVMAATEPKARNKRERILELGAITILQTPGLVCCCLLDEDCSSLHGPVRQAAWPDQAALLRIVAVAFPVASGWLRLACLARHGSIHLPMRGPWHR